MQFHTRSHGSASDVRLLIFVTFLRRLVLLVVAAPVRKQRSHHRGRPTWKKTLTHCLLLLKEFLEGAPKASLVLLAAALAEGRVVVVGLLTPPRLRGLVLTRGVSAKTWE